MDDLEQRVAAKLREALDVCIDDGDGAIDTKGLAQVVIAAVREWDKEQGNAAEETERQALKERDEYWRSIDEATRP